MTDERLRELERRWRATGATADGAAFLLERVRRDDLELACLRLAAHCGRADARMALTELMEQGSWEATELPGRGASYSEVARWTRELQPWGPGALVRAALAAASLAAGARAQELARVSERLPILVAELLATARRSLEADARAARRELEPLLRELESFRQLTVPIEGEPPWAAQLAARSAWHAAGSSSMREPAERAGLAADDAARAVSREPARWAYGPAEVIADDQGLSQSIPQPPAAACARVQLAMAQELCAWAMDRP